MTDKPKYRFCWHCAKQLRGNFFAEYSDENGHTYIVHRQCKEELETGNHYSVAIDDAEYEAMLED